MKTTDGGGQWARQQGWLDLDPKRGCSLVERRSDSFDEKESPTFSMHTKIDYETVDGRDVPKTICLESHGVDGGSTHHSMTIESCQFGLPPAKVFELASYGDFPLPKSGQQPSAYRFAWVASAFTLLAMLFGCCTTLMSVRRRRLPNPCKK